MKTLIPAAIRCSLMFTAVAALSLAYPASVQAVPTTYQYTGNPFTFASRKGSFTTSDFVTVTLTLPQALQANSPYRGYTPTDFTISAGSLTITEADPLTPFRVFSFATSGGHIIDWDVVVVLQSPNNPSIATHSAGLDLDIASDSGHFSAFNTGMPGVWTGRLAPDAGSTLSLMTLTFMALGVAARGSSGQRPDPRQGWQK